MSAAEKKGRGLLQFGTRPTMSETVRKNASKIRRF